MRSGAAAIATTAADTRTRLLAGVTIAMAGFVPRNERLGTEHFISTSATMPLKNVSYVAQMFGGNRWQERSRERAFLGMASATGSGKVWDERKREAIDDDD